MPRAQNRGNIINGLNDNKDQKSSTIVIYHAQWNVLEIFQILRFNFVHTGFVRRSTGLREREKSN